MSCPWGDICPALKYYGYSLANRYRPKGQRALTFTGSPVYIYSTDSPPRVCAIYCRACVVARPAHARDTQTHTRNAAAQGPFMYINLGQAGEIRVHSKARPLPQSQAGFKGTRPATHISATPPN
eukprot:2992989-Pyramimonas_sp.AAC.3